MAVFLRALWFLYMVVPFPYIVGKVMWEEDETVLKAILSGYALCGSLYYIISQIAIMIDLNLKQFTIVNMITVVAVSAIIIIVKKKHVWNYVKALGLKIIRLEWYIKIMIMLILIVSTLMSLAGNSGNWGGEGEIALTAWSNNVLSGINPYTGEVYCDRLREIFGQTYALGYAVAGKMLSINPILVMKYVFPFIWISLAFASVYLFGKKLFQNNKKKDAVFMLFVLVLYMMGFSGKQSQTENLMLASWNEVSILTNIIIPALICLCIDIYEYVSAKENRSRRQTLRLCILLLCVCISAHCVSGYGLPFCGMILTVFIGIYLVRRWKVYAGNSEPN